MSLKDLLSLADDKLHDVFNRKAPDLTKLRKAVLKGIETTERQFASVTPVRGRKWFKVNNEVVEFNLPFGIQGKSKFYVPAERFGDFLTKLKSTVTGGELDKEIAAGKTDAPAASAPKVRKRAPQSPEVVANRVAKAAATRAAKKAAAKK